MFSHSLYPGRVKGFTIIEFIILISVLAVITVLLFPNFVRSGDKAKYISCCENLKKTGAAIQMYAGDNDGYYPANLKKLTPNYLPELPKCPASGDVYNYKHGINVFSMKRTYTINCQTNRHQGALNTKQTMELPSYTSERGLRQPPDD